MIRKLTVWVMLLLMLGLASWGQSPKSGAEDGDPQVVEKVESGSTPAVEEAQTESEVDSPKSETDSVGVYVIPIRGAIASPTLYIVRRGVKEAIENNVDVILIDMNTPGGALKDTLEIMKVLDRFPGETITFINNEAISAGAFISVITDRIYFTDDGQIGAAEVVSGTGQEIPEGMKRKLQSYINAKVRIYTEEYRYRGDVKGICSP